MQWIAGINTITYMMSTLICVFTLDRIGRRWTLYWGSVGQAIALFLAGGLANLAKKTGNTQAGNAAVAMVFLFTCIFGATWLTVPWLYPAEVRSSQCCLLLRLLTSTDLSPRNPCQGQRLGRRRLVYWQRLAHSPLPRNVRSHRRIHTLHLCSLQYHNDPYGLGTVS